MKLLSYTRLLLFAALLSILPLASSQGQALEENPEIRTMLDKMFEHLDRTKVPTRLLLDYAFDLVDFGNFDGYTLCDTNYVNNGTYEYMLRSIRSAAVLAKPFKEVQGIMQDIAAHGSASKLAAGIVLYKYNYMRSDALTGNYIRFTNDQVYDNYVNGLWQNPYAEKYLFGFSPHINLVKGQSFDITFPTNLCFSNVNISKLEFDPGNGQGYQPISLGGTRSLQYGDVGDKELKLKATLSSGEVLVCHSLLKVESSPVLVPLDPAYWPDKVVDMYSNDYLGVMVKAKLRIRYADNNYSRKIQRPFIIAEGFDPLALANNPDDYTRGTLSIGDILDAMDKTSGPFPFREYDVIYIDWQNSEECIQAHAQLLRKIIDWTNNEKRAAGSTEGNIILAQSMGGLIARYALKNMELNGVKHETSVLIYHDVPHHGATVPVGFLYAVHGLLSLYWGGDAPIDLIKWFTNANDTVGSSLDMLERIMYCPAAQQMLVNYVNPQGVVDNSVHRKWQNEIDLLGFPTGDDNFEFRALAISNGGSGSLAPNRSLLDLYGEVHTSFLGDMLFSIFPIIPNLIFRDWAIAALSILPGKSKMDMSLIVEPNHYPNQLVCALWVKYRKKVLWCIPATKTLFEMECYTPNVDMPYDYFPGSTFTLAKDPIQESGDLGINFYHLANSSFDFSMINKIMFVPTASSLCIGSGKTVLTKDDYWRSYFLSTPREGKGTPFGYNYYLANAETSHTALNADICQWLTQQLKTKIEGSRAAEVGTKYTLSEFSGGVYWQTSDPSIAKVNSQTGVIEEIPCKYGFVELSATYQIGSKSYTIGKDIMVGMPNMYLRYQYTTKGYEVLASCAAVGEVLFRERELFYEWGIKTDDQPIQWTLSSESSFCIGIPTEETHTTVFMRVKTKTGRVGKAYNISVLTEYPYFYYPEYLVLNSHGELYSNNGALIGTIDTYNEIACMIKRKYAFDQQGIYWEYYALFNDEIEESDPIVFYNEWPHISSFISQDKVLQLWEHGEVQTQEGISVNYLQCVLRMETCMPTAIQKMTFKIIYKRDFPRDQAI